MAYSKTVPYSGGGTLYAKPVTDGSLPSSTPTWATDVVSTTASNSSGVTFTGLTDGQAYWVFEQVGGSPASTDLVYATFDPASDLASLSADILEIKAKTGLIGVNSASLSAVAVPEGSIPSIIIGDDYKVANGREYSWEFDAITGFTLGVATGKFGAKKPGSETTNFFLVTCLAAAITDLGGGRWKVVFEIDQNDTNSLAPGSYDWSVEIVQSGEEVTIARNADTRTQVKLLRKQT